jgi:hypothetical protein
MNIYHLLARDLYYVCSIMLTLLKTCTLLGYLHALFSLSYSQFDLMRWFCCVHN